MEEAALLACFIFIATMHSSWADNSVILDLHNNARRQVGVGPLVWDSSLEKYAKNLLLHSRNQCYPDPQSNRYGQNLGRGTGNDNTEYRIPADISILMSWIGEEDTYDFNSNSCVGGRECRHYTQIVWHSSDHVGCAAVPCNSTETGKSSSQVTLLCLYDPPGNAAGQYPYLFQRPFVYNSNSWKNNLSIEQRSWVFTDGTTYRPVLLTTIIDDNPPIGFGFFTDGSKGNRSNTFYLGIFSLKITHTALSANKNLSSINLLAPPVIFWSANRDNPVRENATLEFTSKGNLLLKDSDGSLVWSTNTSGLLVQKMSLTTQGNLVLENSTGHTVWQSFDHPTDTLLPNQVLSVGKKLVARNSSSSLASGQFFLTATPEGIDAFIGVSSPQRYRTYQLSKFLKLQHLSKDIAFIEKLPNGLQFNVYADIQLGLPYVVLEPNGHLTMYQPSLSHKFNISFEIQGDFLEDRRLGECSYPTSCGDLGICSNGQCSCPGGKAGYFVHSNDSLPTKGCKQVKPLSCEDVQQHTFLELTNVTYFNFVPQRYNVNKESCKEACLSSCSCKAAIFHYWNNMSLGNCSLESQIYSFRTLGNESSGSSYAFIRVQRVEDVKKSSFVRILVIVLSLSFLVVIIFSGACYRYKLHKKSNKEADDQVNEEEEIDNQVIGAFRRFRLSELKSATRDFQTRLGRGGFGSVFKGVLENGTKIAVKRLDSKSQGLKEFLAEVNTIGKIHHFNLVKLIGYCREKSKRLLVYEHMCNGSLDKWIFSQEQKTTNSLTWEMRKKIIVGLAKGLEYLHEHCNPKIIHFDIKPQNILLDENFNAKIADFGLAKLMTRDQSQVLTVLKGTPGYLAPELFKGTNISEKIDVYSFGIVMIETISRRRNCDHRQSQPLIDIVKERAEQDRLFDFIDQHFEDEHSYKEDAEKMMKIALCCLQAHNRRPPMSVIVKVLEGGPGLEFITTYGLLNITELEAPLTVSSRAVINSYTPTASVLSGPR
ncbi:PREDICTED: G-type lectin S-receptor-like serine/threonine-protein kinase SD2-5 [Ipomoea nil]|uniref:G-type lectin S-receptor-like serine/threonine-protein kinase SD2-5 n=1 Tax=Ipomoea nil TaxID=35883 RepID=UPI000900EC45|nr:PREDICTED: G-type lectin S-receptor-like serine/threonine-protein kinase SD2-5 [Ipomoea nil]